MIKKMNPMLITSTIKYAIIVAAVLIGIGVKVYFGDNPIEEEAEDAIEYIVEQETGVDLTPILSPAKVTAN